MVATLLLFSMTKHDSATQSEMEAFSGARLLTDAARRAVRYRASLAERRVAPLPAALAALAQLRQPLPTQGSDPLELLATLDRVGSPATLAMAGGRYFGFVNGSSLPVTVAANWLATAWDQNCALASMSPIAGLLEEIALEWIVEALDLPRGTNGAFVVGATMASLTALAAARHAVLTRAGWDVEADGLFGAPAVTVVVGEEVHVTIRRVLGLLGLGRTRTLTLPVDEQGRIVPRALPKLTAPSIVCLQAGHVNTGAFDPAAELCAWAHDAGAWVHVDGAFGLWARAAPTRAALAAGFEHADSWATDGHKWLSVPYDCGMALVRDAHALRAAMALQASYLPPSGARDPLAYSPDGSRRARAVDVWAALSFLGREGLAALVERCCRHATRIASELRAAGYDVLNEVSLNQVLVAFGDDAETQAVIRRVQEAGVCWCGGARWRGREAMRISVSSWATTDADVDASLASILECARAAIGARP